MAQKIEKLEKELQKIKERNRRVELDKAWETSFSRRFLIFILTYVVIVIFFFFASLPNPFLNAIVPALAYVLSTLTVPVFKTYWIKRKTATRNLTKQSSHTSIDSL